jgi:LysM repeat protein
MSKWPASWRVILLIVFCCILSGCVPIAETPADEEKDPNFVEGRNHLNMMDYKGAIEAFERAVQANPRNAAAHFELAVLYDNRMKDPLTAAYYYKKHLQLRPKSEYLVAATTGLQGCKMDVAKTVGFVVVNEQVHKDMARLTNELANAQRLIEQLRGQLAAKPTVVTQWMKFAVTNYLTNYIQVASAAGNVAVQTQAVRTIVPPASRTVVTNTATRITPLPGPATNTNRGMQQRAAANAQTRTREATVAPRTRTHVVRSGDTMSNVARRYGISLQRLQAANPSVNARQMRAGQTLNIPTQ